MVALTICNAEFETQKPLIDMYPKELVTLGDYLRKARLDKKMFQSEVAKALNVNEETIRCWELNRNTPTAKFAKRIISFLGYIPRVWKKEPQGKQLYYARQVKGVTHRQLSKDIKVDATTLLEFENETRTPSKKTLQKVLPFIEEVLYS